MRKTGAVIALLTAGLLLLALFSPAVARGPGGMAWGSVDWAARGGELPDLRSTFFVYDATPGEASSSGDRGTYRLRRGDPVPGTLTIDVRCVRVDEGWAEFAGIVTRASGVYVVGEVFRVSVKDGGRRNGDEIGMKSHDFDLAAGCEAALDDEQFGRKGIIEGGDIKIRARR